MEPGERAISLLWRRLIHWGVPFALGAATVLATIVVRDWQYAQRSNVNGPAPQPAPAGVRAQGQGQPTAVPTSFVRYAASDVVRAFNAAGLVAEAPVPTADPSLADLRVATFDFLPYGQTRVALTGVVIVAANQDEVATAVRYLDDRSKGRLKAYTWQIHRNVIVAFGYATSAGPPNATKYWAVLAGMP